jgi:hypothetical protein
MGARSFSATALLAMLIVPNGGPVTLHHLSPSTLEPAGPAIRIDWSEFAAHPLTRAGETIVVQTKTGVKVVDSEALRIVASYPLRRPDVCAVGLDGETAVALVGCTASKHPHYAVVRLGPGDRSVVSVQPNITRIAYPVSFAFGDGQVFVAHAEGAADAVNLATGRVTPHRPRRTLAKGEGFTRAEWLGSHLLGLDGTVVDVRTWKRRTLAAHAERTIADGNKLATFGTDGVAVFTRPDLRLYRRVLRGQYIDDAAIVGNVLYARVALVWHVLDLRTGRTIGRLVPDNAMYDWLVPD